MASWWSCVLIGLVALVASSVVRAHELEESRRLIISIGPSGPAEEPEGAGSVSIDVLVVYELPSSSLARDLRAAIDHDRSGAVDRPTEELAQTQIVMPRVTAGWGVEVAGERVVLDVVGIELREADGVGARRGFEGMVLLTLAEGAGREALEALLQAQANGEDEPLAIRVVVDEGVARVDAELQVLRPLTIARSVIPPANDAPIVGPVTLAPDLPLEVWVGRPVLAETDGGSGAGEGTGL